MTSPDLPADDVIDALDSFYCHNVVVALWADAVANRLEGSAIYLLSDEIPEVAEQVDGGTLQSVGHRVGPQGHDDVMAVEAVECVYHIFGGRVWAGHACLLLLAGNAGRWSGHCPVRVPC